MTIWIASVLIPAPAAAQISYPADTTVAYAEARGREAADGDHRGDLTLLGIAGAAQQTAFRQAYAQRKSDRRMSNAVVGLAVGAMIGLFVVVPHQ